jgi:hypothetical protein
LSGCSFSSLKKSTIDYHGIDTYATFWKGFGFLERAKSTACKMFPNASAKALGSKELALIRVSKLVFAALFEQHPVLNLAPRIMR